MIFIISSAYEYSLYHYCIICVVFHNVYILIGSNTRAVIMGKGIGHWNPGVGGDPLNFENTDVYHFQPVYPRFLSIPPKPPPFLQYSGVINCYTKSLKGLKEGRILKVLHTQS